MPKSETISRLFRTKRQTLSVNPQEQCALLSRLPREIRDLIWEEVLGGMTIHLVRTKSKVKAILCGLGDDHQRIICKHPCWGNSEEEIKINPIYYRSKVGGLYTGPLEDFPVTYPNLLGLVCTCRQIYAETISTLYTHNSFQINHLATLIQLSATPALSHIRTLNLYHFFPVDFDPTRTPKWMKVCGPIAPYDLATWQEGCRALARMSRLRDLNIHIGGYSLCFFEMFSAAVEPLRDVQPSRQFEVLLPWANEVEGYVIYGMPFVLRGVLDKDCC